jgi:hypothetical protein
MEPVVYLGGYGFLFLNSFPLRLLNHLPGHVAGVEKTDNNNPTASPVGI